MSRQEKRVLRLWLVLVLLGNGFALLAAAILGSVWLLLAVLGVIVFDLYWFYVRYLKRRKPRYPLVPPEGRADVYFPSSNIPRPVVAEARRFEEKQRKHRKLKRRLRRVVRKKA